MKETLNQYLAESMKSLREDKGITQSHVAKFIGTTQSCVGKYERGETRLTADFIEQYFLAIKEPLSTLFVINK